MKKLKLNLSNIEGAEMLTREQLKKIVGGTGGSDCGMGVWETCAGQGLGVNPVTCECSKLVRTGCLSDEECGGDQHCYVNNIGYGTCL
ncbi:MAG TPA: hypothetical protein DCQ50_15770 [Chryseobacterium sp.]|nr:hypothetical protein [Chryseobacterium sp.]